MKPKFSIVLRVAVSVGLVGFLLWSMRNNFPRIAGTLAHANLLLFSSAVLLFVFNVMILSVRLKLLFTGEGLPIPFGKVIQLSFIGYFFNNFMPTAVGGDIVKAYYAHRQTGQTAKSFISVFMDRFIGLFTFICLATLALILSWKNIDIGLKKIVLIFAFAGTAIFFIILNGSVAKVVLSMLSKFKLWNIGERISRVYRAAHEYKNKKGIIFAAIGVSLAAQSTYFLVVYLFSKSVGSGLHLGTIFLIMPIVCVITMLPSLGGLGLREGAIVAFFGPLMGTDKAFSMSILLLAMLLVLSLIGGLIYAFASQFKIKKAEIEKLETYSV